MEKPKKEKITFKNALKKNGKTIKKAGRSFGERAKPFLAPLLLVIIAGGVFFLITRTITRFLDKIKEINEK